MSTLVQMSEALQRGDAKAVAQQVQQAIDGGMDAQQILDDGLVAGMRVVGDEFKQHLIFLPDVLLAAKAMYAGLDLLKPLLVKGDIPMRGKVVIGTVQGDVHDIGKNLVGIMLQGAGYQVTDLGHDVTAEQYVDTAVAQEAGVIGVSALLTTTMGVMKQVSELLDERGLRDKVKLIIGGAPVTKEYAAQVRADAYGYDAVKAVELVDGIFGAGEGR